MKQEAEIKEDFEKFTIDLRSSAVIIGVFIAVVFVLRFILSVPVPISVFPITLVWLAFYLFLGGRLLKRCRTQKKLHRIYLAFNLMDVFFETVLMHLVGATFWVGPLFYVFTIVLAGILLPSRMRQILTGASSFSYTSLVLLEYLGVLSYRPLFAELPADFSLSFVLSQIAISNILFFYTSHSVGEFADMLRTNEKRLRQEKEKAKETGKVLEVKVKARTKELQELAERREEIIEDRTRELKRKLEELEKFRRLVVGREMKMMELKKEIERLKKETEKA